MNSPQNKSRHKPLLLQWLREPLLHFVLVGFGVFAVSAALQDQQAIPDEPDTNTYTIRITPDDLLQMQLALRVDALPPRHTPAFDSLIETRVREEILYREALAMGLDKNDVIVKRRMAQKMDFLAEDISALREPTQQELKAWYQAHTEDFATAPRITFRHRFFAFDQHGDAAQEVARTALARIAANTPADQLGDPFMFQDHYPDRTPIQISSVFGPDFSRELLTLPTGQWAGPVESGFGWHLVYIDTLTPARIPEFEEVASEVSASWIAQQREAFKRAAYESMRAKYEVVLPAEDDLVASASEN